MVYEETKVCKPNEFEFVVKITPLTDKPLILLISYFLRKVSGKTSEMKRLLQSKLAFPSLHKPYHEINMWCENSWRIEHLQSYPGRVGGTFVAPVSWNTLENASGVTYSETHGPSTTLDMYWKGGKRYNKWMWTWHQLWTCPYPSFLFYEPKQKNSRDSTEDWIPCRSCWVWRVAHLVFYGRERNSGHFPWQF